MDLTYKRATIEDIDILTETRIIVLRAANRLPDTAGMGEVKEQSYRYYQSALRDGSHVAYLVFDGSRFVGVGGVSLFRVMPAYHNPSGNKAYIMNMYTDPAYRRRGGHIRLWTCWSAPPGKRGSPLSPWRPRTWDVPCMKSTVLSK